MAIMHAAGAITRRREMSKHATTDVTWSSRGELVCFAQEAALVGEGLVG